MSFHSNLLCLLLIAGPQTSFAEDHLQSCATLAGLDLYEKKLDELMSSPVTGIQILGVNVVTSFSPEWGIRVAAVDNFVYLYSMRLDRSFWNSGWRKTSENTMVNDPTTASAKVITRSITISKKLSDILTNEWRIAIQEAQPSTIGGNDGESYYFLMPNGRCGTTWSPDPHTKAGKLVSIVEALQKLAERPETSNEGGEAMIIELLHDLKK